MFIVIVLPVKTSVIIFNHRLLLYICSRKKFISLDLKQLNVADR